MDEIEKNRRALKALEGTGEAGVWLGGFVLFILALCVVASLYAWLPAPNTWRL